VFQFGIGHEAPAIMITDRTYNTNNWTGVQAKRRGRQGNIATEAVSHVDIITLLLQVKLLCVYVCVCYR